MLLLLLLLVPRGTESRTIDTLASLRTPRVSRISNMVPASFSSNQSKAAAAGELEEEAAPLRLPAVVVLDVEDDDESAAALSPARTMAIILPDGTSTTWILRASIATARRPRRGSPSASLSDVM